MLSAIPLRRVILATLAQIVALTVTVAFVSLVAVATPPTVAPADPHRYLDDIKALTTPAMEGRGDGTKGLSRAAHLIEQRFKSLGLEPAGKKSYFQSFTVTTGASLKGKNHFTVIGEKKRELT